jgi:hypothetical protein
MPTPDPRLLLFRERAIGSAARSSERTQTPASVQDVFFLHRNAALLSRVPSSLLDAVRDLVHEEASVRRILLGARKHCRDGISQFQILAPVSDVRYLGPSVYRGKP